MIVSTIPAVIFWNWLNLLPLAMSNQLGVRSIEEDRINKPWRPIPAGSLSREETRILMVASYAGAILASFYLGGFWESIALVVEGWVYNGLEGGNGNSIVRNALNAVGYMTFASGAARVACFRSGTELQSETAAWFILLGGVIATTVQFQDLYDQEGDSARGRQTFPLVAGDGMVRLTTAFFIALWSWVCPAFWNLALCDFLSPLVLSALITFRLYRYRSAKEDKRSFLIWNAWVMTLYLLPLRSSNI